MTRDADTEDAVGLGTIVGVHGVRGAMRYAPYNLRSTALAPGVAVTVGAGATRVRTKVVHVAAVPGKKILRLALEAVSDRDAAIALVGTELSVARSALPPLAEDEFYLRDVLGFHVRRPDGEHLGEVVGVGDNGAQELLEVRAPGPAAGLTWLLPAVAPLVVAVDLEQRTIVADVPEGMLPEALERRRGS
jgi:16S rRNA processing protein RimM